MYKKILIMLTLVLSLGLSILDIQAQNSSMIEWIPESKQFVFRSAKGQKQILGAQEEEDDSLNRTWNDFSQSFLSIDYLDAKGKVRRSSSKNAKIKIKQDGKAYDVRLHFDKTDIEIEFCIQEKEGEIVFELKDENIHDPQEALMAIYPFPFMLASKHFEKEDYYLVPEGNGALYFHDQVDSQVKNPYRARYYGADYASQGTGESMYEKKHMPKLSLPVYAAKIQDLSMITYISQGAEYTDLLLYPKDLVTSYHWISPRLVYREQFFKRTNQKGDGYYTSQEERNHFDFKMNLHIFDESVDYSEMAQWLQSQLFSQKPKEESVPFMNIDLLLNEKKDTFLWPQNIEMTTYSEALTILKDIQSDYDGGIHLNLQGFGNKGHALAGIQYIPSIFKRSWFQDLQDFLQDVQNLGIESSLDLNYFEASPKTYRMKKDDYSQALSERNLFFEKDQSYLLHPLSSQSYLMKELETWKKLPIDSLYLKGLSQHLYGSFDRKKALSREDAKVLQKAIVKEIPFKLRMDGFYDYLHQDEQTAVVNANLGSSNHYLFSQDIPFASMVFRSYVPYYSRAINLEGHRKDYLLRLLEYGAYPSYLISHRDESALIDSYQQELYGIAYENLATSLQEDWKFLQPAYEAIGNSRLLKHHVLSDGLVKVRYEKASIIINYSKNEKKYKNNVIEAKSYLILGGDK